MNEGGYLCILAVVIIDKGGILISIGKCHLLMVSYMEDRSSSARIMVDL